jgi:hypothetical protein
MAGVPSENDNVAFSLEAFIFLSLIRVLGLIKQASFIPGNIFF